MSEVATAPLDSVFGILTNKWGIYVHNPTVTRENCAVQHWKVSYNKNRIDPICENVVVQLNVGLCKWTFKIFIQEKSCSAHFRFQILDKLIDKHYIENPHLYKSDVSSPPDFKRVT
jgi:hypothetical protein